uniref:Uncharacterized protein n=1 Tax=Anguilla anguilla TaxID=7936 RepID=A0A0E9RFP4_ANGAN
MSSVNEAEYPLKKLRTMFLATTNIGFL